MQASAPSAVILESILAAFNDHDLDAVMSFFSQDCVLEMPRGPDPWGARYVGFAAVKDGLRSRFAGIPDVRYDDDTHLVCGNVGISRWTLRGTSVDGERVEVNGCDFYTFDDGKVVKKDSYWKIRQR